MCQFASFVVSRDERVFWKDFCDSHSEILRANNISDTNNEHRYFAKVEVVPPADWDGRSTDELDDWKFLFDPGDYRDWFSNSHKEAVLSTLRIRLESENVTRERCENCFVWHTNDHLTLCADCEDSQEDDEEDHWDDWEDDDYED